MKYFTLFCHAKSSKSCVNFTAFAVFKSSMELVAIDYTAQLAIPDYHKLL